jgi:4-amino-4-deoxy-L-arabinose transferase-like glycosyltransferase
MIFKNLARIRFKLAKIRGSTRSMTKTISIINHADLLRKKSALAAAIVIAVVLAAGVLYSFYLGDTLRFLPDERDYVTLAENLVARGIYSLDGENPTAYRAPGYPLFLAAFRLFGAGPVHFRILNYLLLGLCMVVAYRALAAQSLPLAAGLAPMLVAFYPVFFYTAGTLYPQTLASFLFLLVLYLFIRPAAGRWVYVWGGLLLGWLVLTVPTFILALVVFPAWLWTRRERRSLHGVLLMLAAASLLVGIWTVRNYSAFGAFVFVSTNSGENLLLGNSEHTTPNAGTNVDITAYQARAEDLGEVQRDRYYRSAALEYLLAHPGESARMYLLKVLNYFNFRNELVTTTETSWAKDLLILLTYGSLLLALVFRLVFARRFKLLPFESFLVIFYLLNALASAVFFTRIRFRIPFDFLLVLVAAAFIDRLVEARKKSNAAFMPQP